MAYIRNKRLVAKFFIFIILSQAFLSNMMTHPNMAMAEFKSGMNPGMQIRLEQTTIESFRRAMEEFLPTFMDVRENTFFPSELHYEFGILFDMLHYKIDWTDIHYGPVDLDIADVRVWLHRNFGKALLKVRFPALKHWEITGKQRVNFLMLPDDSDVRLLFKDFKVEFETDL